MALVTLVVDKGDVENARLLYLAGLYLELLVLSCHDALVLHALNGNVVKILSALSMWVISVPTCGNGSKSLNILLVGTRIEDEPIAKCLEQSEVGVSLVRLLVDIVGLYVLLIFVYDFQDTVVSGIDA